MSLLLAIIGHLVGDYLLQNDWMALNKKADWRVCCFHCLIWTTSVCSFAGWVGTWHTSLVVVPILYFSHLLQDKTNVVVFWMDWIGQREFRTGVCSPWSTIVVDNVWHIVTIWAVWRFLMHQI